MYAYPPQAAFEKPVPKTTIYKHARPPRRIQQRFVEQVSRITWQYKLSPETTNLPARAGIAEIQVLVVTLKGDELDEAVLRTIDKAINFPIFFEVAGEERIRLTAAYKRPSDADKSKWVVGDYYHTDWQPADAARAPLPVAVDLARLYGQMLRSLMPLPPTSGESLKAHAERLAAIRIKENECRQLEARVRATQQFNRKVELNAQLRTAKKQLQRLTG